jgi:hypothetical protein
LTSSEGFRRISRQKQSSERKAIKGSPRSYRASEIAELVNKRNSIKVDSLMKLQAETTAELAALLPPYSTKRLKGIVTVALFVFEQEPLWCKFC